MRFYYSNHFAVEEEKICDTVGGLDYLESPVSDGTIEENFEEELVNAPVSSYNSIYSFRDNEDEDEDFSDVSQYGIVEVVGDDAYGRKIITVTACKLPNSNQLDHQRLLRLFLKHFTFLSCYTACPMILDLNTYFYIWYRRGWGRGCQPIATFHGSFKPAGLIQTGFSFHSAKSSICNIRSLIAEHPVECRNDVIVELLMFRYVYDLGNHVIFDFHFQLEIPIFINYKKDYTRY